MEGVALESEYTDSRWSWLWTFKTGKSGSFQFWLDASNSLATLGASSGIAKGLKGNIPVLRKLLFTFNWLIDFAQVGVETSPNF